MKKRILIIFAVAVLLVGCGNTDNKNTEADTQQTETESTTETLEANTEEETTHTHAYTEAITTEATCEADGVKTFTCECGDSYTEPIKAIGHDYKDDVTAPTCSEKGYTTHTCNTCGNAYTDTEVSATGHSYGKYTYNNDATYEKDGTETATCSACGKKDTRTKAGTKLGCPYEIGVWYDLDWQFIKVCATKEEALQEAHGASPQYQAILNERYPEVLNSMFGSSVASAGYTEWGYWVCTWRIPPEGRTDVIPWTTK